MWHVTRLFLLTTIFGWGLAAQPSTGGPGGGGPRGPSGPPTTIGSSYKPNIDLSYQHPTFGLMQIGHMSVVTVAYGTTISSMGFQLDVGDGDHDPVGVATTMTNIGATGINLAEWSSATGPVPYSLMPTSGVFNQATGQNYVFSISANDGYWTSDFECTIVQTPAPMAQNSAPTLSIFDNRGAASRQVVNGATLHVNYSFQLADFAFQLSVGDADGDSVSVTTTISDVAGTGILESEWGSSPATAPYTLAPVSGVFNTAAGVTHQLTIIGDDGADQSVLTFFIVQAPLPGPSVPAGLEGGAGGGGCVADASTHLWPMLMLLIAGAIVAIRKACSLPARNPHPGGPHAARV